ncbi:MAG TPA: PilN domain-containing protein [Kofleriaceae bacterium]|jgi:Tfp pilus assembly protein PilN
MIKVNLLPSRKAAKKAATADPSAKQMFLGVASVIAVLAAIYLLVDRPKRAHLTEVRHANEQLDASIREKKKTLQGYDEMKKSWEEANKRAEAIDRLMQNKVIPANSLHELSRILTLQGPTMSEGMSTLVATDANKRFESDWDGKHVWIFTFVDTNGAFRIEGGAQSESDVTQLSKRLAASVYFYDINPAGGERVVDTQNNVNYYRFTITGRIAY